MPYTTHSTSSQRHLPSPHRAITWWSFALLALVGGVGLGACTFDTSIIDNARCESSEDCDGECIDGWCIIAADVGTDQSELFCGGKTCWEDQACCILEDESEGCVPIVNDPANCGGCGVTCTQNMLCDNSACICALGFEDCNSDQATDGCETDIRDDTAHCGGCNISCDTDGTCAFGICLCESNKADCDPATPGCETDLTTSFYHCGGCDNACSTNETCRGGICLCGENEKPCAIGQPCCQVEPEPGSCTDTMKALSHCGACGVTCGPGEACKDGACVCGIDTISQTGEVGAGAACGSGNACCGGICLPENDVACKCGDNSNCDAGEACCGEECVGILDDNTNCGVCGKTCKEGSHTCSGGTCVCVKAGTVDCGGTCVKILENPSHCGTCGNTCDIDEICCDGVCRDTANDPTSCDGCGVNFRCQASELCCNGSCELVGYNPAHCAACGDDCNDGRLGDVSTVGCNDHVCTFSCALDWGDCNGDLSDGCETNLLSDETHCGVCNNNCGALSCEGGVCTCEENTADCNAYAGDGCEADLTSLATCGACDFSCGPDQTCIGGACYCVAKNEDENLCLDDEKECESNMDCKQ